MSGPGTSLPYTDTKPVGAADFYFAINATFQFVQRRLGMEGLRRYWTELGSQYYAPVSRLWKEGGMAAIATYWRDFFKAEPGSTVEVHELPDEVRLEVRVCPVIKHLRDNGRTILPCLCQHCYFVSEAMATPAAYTVRISGGNGSCTQRFLKREAVAGPQKLEDITEVT
ncbi:hypothetical protein DES53_11019 [Roseimicrobium gellanilyticum]|uniref:L-2-amino-thiazoline-4-carboxylic acid hydrolase-like protein n=1 Tax=Roseimicrobium gellanilyticum TaxID=748857 RepID=A0A366H9Z1_9BACT|nr:hypothetical protein [Roseimicrobium gellanilyticum]RBP38996.1 hypothetical protein DES53_11019 [Roseimicrobium gellanilyticum]